MAQSPATPIAADLRPSRAPEARRAGGRGPRTWRDVPGPLRWLGAVLTLLLIAVAIFLMVFQWNWLRGPLDAYLSARMHRQVIIHGDLSAHIWSWTPSATAADITVAQPAWAGGGQMATLPRLTIALDLKALLGGRLVLSQVDAERPAFDLRRDGAGRENWSFAPPGKPPPPLKLPPIRNFTIDDGRLTLNDAERGLTFAGQISSNETAVGAGRGRFTLTGQGTLNGAPFVARIGGGPLINVDPDKSYPFTTDLRSGSTHVVATGTISHPFDFSSFQATGRVSGEDLVNLYDLTGYTFPASPPYDLAGRLTRQGDRFDFDDLHGRIGSSDVSGHLVAQKKDGRRDLTGDLVSHRLKLADMTAIIGGAPRGAMKGAILSPTQQVEAARLTAQHRVLPDAPLDIGRVRQMDADVHVQADSVDAGSLPIRRLTMRIRLDHGLLSLDPLVLSLSQGAVSGSVRLDARGATPVTSVNLALDDARVEELLPPAKGAPPLQGALVARLRLAGPGRSVRAAAGAADGVLAVAIPQGQMRQLLAELMGVDVTKSLFLYLSNAQKPTPVRCAVAEFKAQDGVLTAQRVLIDTGDVLAQGGGTVNLRDETLNLEITGKPKHFRLIRLAAPITLKGRLDDPKLGVDLAKAAPQAGAAVALGVVASPFAAVLPFIALGTAKDANCPALMAEAAADGAPVGH